MEDYQTYSNQIYQRLCQQLGDLITQQDFIGKRILETRNEIAKVDAGQGIVKAVGELKRLKEFNERKPKLASLSIKQEVKTKDDNGGNSKDGAKAGEDKKNTVPNKNAPSPGNRPSVHS